MKFGLGPTIYIMIFAIAITQLPKYSFKELITGVAPLTGESIADIIFNLLLIIVSLITAVFYLKQLMYLLFYKTHKVYRKLSSFGDIDTVLATIDREIISDKVVQHDDKLFIMPTFTLCAYTNCLEYTKDILAAYKGATGHRGSTYLVLKFAPGKWQYKLWDSREDRHRKIQLTIDQITQMYLQAGD